MLALRFGPGNKPNSIKTRQTSLSSDPDVSVRRLRNRVRRAIEHSILYPPRGVCVLRDVVVRIYGPGRIPREERQKKKEEQGNSIEASATHAIGSHDFVFVSVSVPENFFDNHDRRGDVAYATDVGIPSSTSVPELS